MGSLACIGLLGGGFAGCMYKKKQKEQETTQEANTQPQRRRNFGEVSPGGVMLSPNGLTNVRIEVYDYSCIYVRIEV